MVPEPCTCAVVEAVCDPGTASRAPVPPAEVPATNSAAVAISTSPRTVSDAFTFTPAPVAFTYATDANSDVVDILLHA